MRDEIFLIGRILFSLVFVMSGINHFTDTEGSAQYAAYKKVPNAKLMVQLSGVLMLLGGLGVILGVWIDLAALSLAALTLVMAFAMHRFWEDSDPQVKASEMAHFLKNISITGGALVIYSIAVAGAPYMLTDPLF